MEHKQHTQDTPENILMNTRKEHLERHDKINERRETTRETNSESSTQEKLRSVLKYSNIMCYFEFGMRFPS